MRGKPFEKRNKAAARANKRRITAPLAGQSVESLAQAGVRKNVVRSLFPDEKRDAFERSWNRGRALHELLVQQAAYETGILRRVPSVLLEMLRRIESEPGSADTETSHTRLRELLEKHAKGTFPPTETLAGTFPPKDPSHEEETS